MKKKIIVLIIAIVTIINVSSVAILYSDLVSLKAPEITVTVDITEINSNEAVVETIINIYNPNGFDVSVKDLKITTKTFDNKEIANMKIDGGYIPSQETKTYTKSFEINFNGNSPEKLKTTISGIIGMKSGFIEKTIPLAVSVISIVDEVLNKLAAPTANIHVNFGEISQKSINTTILIEAYNPNTFEFGLENVVIDFITDKGDKVGKLEIRGGILPAKGYLNTSGNGTLIIEALNAKFITAKLSSTVTAIIAGFNKSLPFNLKVDVEVPDLKELLPSEFITKATIRADFRLTLRGLFCDIALEVNNPNNIELFAKDITFSLYGIDTEERILMGSCEIGTGIIKPEDTTYIKGELTIPYLKYINLILQGKIIPYWEEVEVTANVTIKGLNNYFWFGVSGLQDIRPFTKDRVFKTD